MTNLSKRRGDTAPSNAGTVFLNQWQRLCFSKRQQSKRVGIVIALLLVMCMNSWRIHLLQPTLESLIHQDFPPDTIYLTLPKKKAHSNTLRNYTLPQFIQDFQQDGTVTVLTPEYDYGSIMKVLQVLHTEKPDTRIVYVDDDWIYPSNLTRVLYNKSLQYSNDALCWSGAVFRNYFRQIEHSSLTLNRHPNLFMQVSGTDTMIGGTDHVVNLAQGAFGVLVKPSFFHLDKLQALVKRPDVPKGVIKSDDFILSAHLTKNNVTIQIVDGGCLPQLVEKAASVKKLSLYMYRHAMAAAYYLQQSLGIWNEFQFYNPADFSQEEWDAIDCEAGRGRNCKGYEKVMRELDNKYPIIR